MRRLKKLPHAPARYRRRRFSNRRTALTDLLPVERAQPSPLAGPLLMTRGPRVGVGAMAIDQREITLEIRPRARFDVLDVRQHLLETHGTALEAFPQALYYSFHTTAGYLDQRTACRLNLRRTGVAPYLRPFQTAFPEGAGYRHDELHLRRELSEEQRRVEPCNGDSHLAFISAGLRACVVYRHRPDQSVHFIDLDGVNDGAPRRRIVTILGFSSEEVVARDRLVIPIAAHSD